MKKYKITDAWLDAEVTITIDTKSTSIEIMKEVCDFWEEQYDCTQVLPENDNNIEKAYAAYCGSYLLRGLLRGRYDFQAIRDLSNEEGYPKEHGIKIIDYSVPEICGTHELNVEELLQVGTNLKE